MNLDLINTVIISLVFLMLFHSAELLYHRIGVKAEISRKYVHIATGVISLVFPLLIDNHWYILALCAGFIVILQISIRFGMLPSINNVGRKTRGSILYPVIVYGCYLVYQYYGQYIYYYLPILILAIADPAAALTGKSFPIGKYTLFGQGKTLAGSLAFFLTAMITSLLLLYYVEGADSIKILVFSGLIATTTTLAEAMTHKGYDNLFIPLTTVFILIVTQNQFILS